jgi:hypothetical protein
VKCIIATILKHEAMATSAFGSVDQIPAFFDGGGCRHLYGYVFAQVHGIACHRGMGKPVGTYIYKINVGAMAQVFPPIGFME